MRICPLCKNEVGGKWITLRNGASFCRPCFDKATNTFDAVENRIRSLQQARPPLNCWDVTSRFFSALNILFLILFVMELASKRRDNLQVLLLLISCIGLFLIKAFIIDPIAYKFSQKRHSDFQNEIEQKIKKIRTDNERLYRSIRFLYAQLWDLPPDWQWRRKQVIARDENLCQHCRTYVREHHVHHVVPKALENGTHSLENLILLCPECHSKVPTRGHSRISVTKKRKKRRKINSIEMDD